MGHVRDGKPRGQVRRGNLQAGAAPRYYSRPTATAAHVVRRLARRPRPVTAPLPPVPAADAAASADARVSALAARYLAAQLAGDRREALRLVVEEGLGDGLAVPDIHLGVIQRAQHEIGRLWQENRISIAREHAATAISQLVLAHLYHHLPRAPRNACRVVVACVEGERHDMPARLATDFLEMAGFEVEFLGADVPTDDLVTLVRERPPGALLLSVTLAFNLPALRDAAARVRTASGGSVPVIAGGHALAGARPAWAEGLVTVSATVHDLVAEARRITGCAVRPERSAGVAA